MSLKQKRYLFLALAALYGVALAYKENWNYWITCLACVAVQGAMSTRTFMRIARSRWNPFYLMIGRPLERWRWRRMMRSDLGAKLSVMLQEGNYTTVKLPPNED